MKQLFFCFVVFLTASCVHYGDELNTCPKVSSVQKMPFRDNPGVDEAYDKLRYDDYCEALLYASLTSLAPMPDPRQVPPEHRLVEGDVALFFLTMRHQIDIVLLLPEDQKLNWKSRGMTAYFNYVASYENRLKLIERLHELLER